MPSPSSSRDDGQDGAAASEEEHDDDMDAVSAWIAGLGGTDPEPDDLAADLANDRFFYNMGGDDVELGEDDDNSEDEPEVRDSNMQPLPDHNIPDYPQENGLYLSGKRYVRNDKMRLDRFMELDNITSTIQD